MITLMDERKHVKNNESLPMAKHNELFSLGYGSVQFIKATSPCKVLNALDQRASINNLIGCNIVPLTLVARVAPQVG